VTAAAGEQLIQQDPVRYRSLRASPLTGGPAQATVLGGPITWAVCVIGGVACSARPAGIPRMVHIVGVNQETVVGLRRRAAGFEYVMDRNGDGTVPLSLARLPNSNAISWMNRTPILPTMRE